MLPVLTILKTATSAFFVAPLLFLLLVLSIPILILLLIVRSIVWLVAKCLRPDLNGMVKGMNSVYTTKAPATMLFVLGFKGSVTPDMVRTSFEKRILNLRDTHTGEFVYLEGVTRTWESYLGYAFWKRETNFDLRTHIRDYDYGGKLSLPVPCTSGDVRKVLGALAEAPWDKSNSPWEMLIIQNYQTEAGETGTSALIARVDHVLIDGYGLLRLMKELCRSPFKVPEPSFGMRNFSVWKKMGLVLKMPWDLVHSLALPFWYTPLGHQSKYSKEQVLITCSPEIDINVVKKIKSHFGVSFAAVTYAALFGALARTLKTSGTKPPQNIVVGFVLPSKIRSEGIEMNLTVMLALWPMCPGTPEERLLQVHRTLKTMSQSTAALALPTFVNFGAHLPIFLRESLSNALTSRLSMGITSFPVTSEPDYFQGCEIVESFGALGSWANLRSIASVGGLNNKQTMSFSMNKSFFADDESVSKLGSYVEQELQSMLDATV